MCQNVGDKMSNVCENNEFEAVQKCTNIVYLCIFKKCCQKYRSLPKVPFDTAENEPFKVIVVHFDIPQISKSISVFNGLIEFRVLIQRPGVPHAQDRISADPVNDIARAVQAHAEDEVGAEILNLGRNLTNR